MPCALQHVGVVDVLPGHELLKERKKAASLRVLFLASGELLRALPRVIH